MRRAALIATPHDPAVIRKLPPHQGRAPAPLRLSPTPARPDRLLEGAADTVVPAPRGAISVVRPVDGGGVSGIACRSGPLGGRDRDALD
jgi:hypothetical protein